MSDKPKTKTMPLRSPVSMDETLKEINKSLGAQTVTVGNEMKKDPPRVPFGVFTMDFALGGGMPLWQSTCGWGAESGGKSLMGFKAMRASELLCWRCFHPATYCTCSQSPIRMRCMYQDIEGTFDPSWVESCGVTNPLSYAVGNCDTAEEWINVAEKVLKTDQCGLLIIDSLAALIPGKELEEAMEYQSMGKHPSLVGKAIRKLKSALLFEKKRGKPCVVYFINQMREKVGMMFGNPETMSGGHAMKHEFSLLFRIAKVKLEDTAYNKVFKDASRDIEKASRHSFEIRKHKVLILSGGGEFVVVKENIPSLNLKRGMIDDSNVMMTFAKEYGVVKEEGHKWRYFDFKAPTQEEIKKVWRLKPDEYIRTSQEIISLAKKRLRGEN